MQSNETRPGHEELPTTGPQRLCTCGFKTSPWGGIDADWDAHLPTSPAADDAPVAWALYGRVTGTIKQIVTDEDVAREESEFYDVRPLYAGSVLS